MALAVFSAAVTGCFEGGPGTFSGAGFPEVLAADAPPVADDAPVRPFLGVYEFVGAESERERLSSAIDEVTTEMSFVTRGIARDKLTEGNIVPRRLVLEARGGRLLVVMDHQSSIGNLDGTIAKVEATEAEWMDLTLEIDADLEQRFVGHEKGRINRFELDGDRLVMYVRVYASALPRDLEYSLTFERL